jgi:trehalose-phosphatase
MTRPLRFSDVRDSISHADTLFVVSDFDGTLCPIASSPDLVQLPANTASVLRRLSRSQHVVLAIISGRSLDDVRRRVGINAIYGGNHGIEVSGRDIEFVHPEAALFGARLDRLCAEMEHCLAPWPEAWVENKQWTATVHMRAVGFEQWPAVIASVRSHMLGSEDMFGLRSGRAALEIYPRLGWDKGSAVKYIRRMLGLERALPICFGDDTTDESMYQALPNGITVNVGPRAHTDAAFTLDGGVEGVTRFLEQLLAEIETPPSRTSVWRAPRGGHCRAYSVATQNE